MQRFLSKLWREEDGGLVAAEYVLLGTLLTIGLLVGVQAVQAGMLRKLAELATLVGS